MSISSGTLLSGASSCAIDWMLLLFSTSIYYSIWQEKWSNKYMALRDGPLLYFPKAQWCTFYIDGSFFTNPVDLSDPLLKFRRFRRSILFSIETFRRTYLWKCCGRGSCLYFWSLTISCKLFEELEAVFTVIPFSLSSKKERWLILVWYIVSY